MCDYSLHGLPNRLALEGEKLVAHRFSTGAMGLTSPAELSRAMTFKRNFGGESFWSLVKAALLPPAPPQVAAVCVPPGARLRISDIPVNLQHNLGIGPEEIATFTQTSAVPNTYHDAVQFPNGSQILLQVLKEGQRVRVLSLASNESTDAEFVRQPVGFAAPLSLSPQFVTAEMKQSVYLNHRRALAGTEPRVSWGSPGSSPDESGHSGPEGSA
jgi:hypothetical protein